MIFKINMKVNCRPTQVKTKYEKIKFNYILREYSLQAGAIFK